MRIISITAASSKATVNLPHFILTLSQNYFIHLKAHIHLQLNLCLKFLHGVRSQIPKADIGTIQAPNEFRILTLTLTRLRTHNELQNINS